MTQTHDPAREPDTQERSGGLDSMDRFGRPDKPPFRWVLPHGVIAHFSEPDHGVREAAGRRAWLHSLNPALPHWLSPKQLHGSVVVSEPHLSDALDNAGDALLSGDPQIGLSVFGSDCPGLVLVSDTGLGVAHCGWRGVAQGIVGALLTAFLAETQAPPSSVHAFIGPGICGACYEVRSDVIDAFAWAPAAVQPKAGGYFQLDLVLAIRAELARLGVQHIGDSGICTACSPYLHSYRHGGPGVSQLLAAYRHSADGGDRVATSDTGIVGHVRRLGPEDI